MAGSLGIVATPAMAAAFTSLGILAVFIGLYLIRKPNGIRDRLSQFALQKRTLEELELEQPFFDRILRPIVRGVARFIVRWTPEQQIEQMRHTLMVAGNPGGLDVRDFIGIRGLSATFLAGICLFLFARGSNPMQLTAFVAGGAALGFILPNLWLKSKVSARKKEIVRALPDALDLLTICVEAGLGFDGALSKVVEKWDNALSVEFNRVISEIRVGVARRDALRDMVHRTEVPDVATFISAVIQADQLGVSLARVLRIQSEQMRVKRRQRAEELAHQAPIKMLFPMVFLIFPAMYVVIIGPALPTLAKGLIGQ